MGEDEATETPAEQGKHSDVMKSGATHRDDSGAVISLTVPGTWAGVWESRPRDPSSSGVVELLFTIASVLFENYPTYSLAFTYFG